MLSQGRIAAACRLLTLADQPESQLCLTQPTAYEKNIAWARSRPQNCQACPHLTHHGYIDKDVLPSSRVAASQHTPKSLGCPS
jgi:hypothetical protein